MSETNEKKTLFNKIFPAIASTIIVMLIGQGIMIYTSIQVLNERVKVTNEKIQVIEMNLDRLNQATANRWTRQNHNDFAEKIDDRFDRIKVRLRELEKRK